MSAVAGGALGAEAGKPSSALTPSSKRTNVLFVISDDLNMRLGCYGDDQVHSPNVDKLASSGMRFDRAYCQYPLCGPSRASFLTGLRPDTTRVVDGVAWLRDKLPKVKTLPQVFKENGYNTVRISKVFHDARTTPDDPLSWDMAIEPYKTQAGSKGIVHRYMPRRVKGVPLGPAVEAEGGDEDQPDGRAASQAIRFLESRDTSQPFFLAVGLRMPHLSWVVPKRYFDMYDPAAIKLPEVRKDAWKNIPASAITLRQFNYGFDEKTSREALRGYYAAVTFMDAQLGKLMDALDRLHLADDTVFVFLGDNGWHVGEHGLWHKSTLFEESLRVPLIVRVPGMKANGRSCNALVECVDICPTLFDVCGLTGPSNLEGTSVRPLLNKPTTSWKTAAFSQQQRSGKKMGRSIRTERWRYTEWDEGRDGVELYDCAADPHEFRNLAGDSAYSSQMADLKRRLRAGWKAAKPPAT